MTSPSDLGEQHSRLIDQLADEKQTYWNFKPQESNIFQQVLKSTTEEQSQFAMKMVEWLENRRKISLLTNTRETGPDQSWRVRSALFELLKRKIPFEHDNVIVLLDWTIVQRNSYYAAVPQIVKVVKNYLQDHPRSQTLEEKLNTLISKLQSKQSTADERKWAVRLRELAGLADGSLPLIAGEAWSDAASTDIRAMESAMQSVWIALLNTCLKATGSVPATKWLTSTEPLMEKLSFAAFKSSLLKWFPLVDKPRTHPIESWSPYQPNSNPMIQDVNADILKGLVWLCARNEDKEMARALTALAISAYRKVPGVGPRCARLGNACVWALGNMPGMEGVAQLAILGVKVKFGSAQTGIANALNTAAKRIGIPADEIAEMSVPTYGLSEVGLRREHLGEFTAELVVIGTNKTEIRWIKPDGKQQASIPQKIKREFATEEKDLKQATKDIENILSAQRDRIENLYLERKKWNFATWRARYLDHPLIGTLARRIIWKFSETDRAATGIWHTGQIVGHDGRALDWLKNAAQVELWHPIDATTETVLGWREWLTQNEIRQPFKQAHREIYLLTDAEINTRVYSNRFAAHILKQHQFNALCAARSWKNKLRLMVDDEYPPAFRLMPQWGLRAEFWIEGIGTNYGTDTNETGTYLYITTDQVPFYAIDARQNSAHAGGGGYHIARRGENEIIEPRALDQIPPLVFSEIMRDVDLFVGVASVGNDPNWADGGRETRYLDYWSNYSFGELGETAKTRKQILERLIPRLKIADRCAFVERFLVVRGDHRTYKIHFGSGNILMEPNDQYLCIVPARGAAITGSTDKVFLPFEGDNTLAIILSKAFLLAEDKKIKDATILRQIGR